MEVAVRLRAADVAPAEAEGAEPRRHCLEPPRRGVVLIWEFLHWYASVGPHWVLG